MNKLVLSFFLFFSIGITISQTFTNSSGGAIGDDNSYYYFPINVSGLSSSSLDATYFGIESVTINLSHPYDGDLRIKLQSPDGNVFVLTSYLGANGDNYTSTTFTDTAANSITTGTPPFTGYFKPIDALSSVNNGQDGNGTWSLNVKDQVSGNTGNVISWSITFGNQPAGSIIFESSNLPIFVINTDGGASIPDEPKIGAYMGIIDNGAGVRNYMTDPFNKYSNKIGIETRGSSSQMFPQASYGFETRDINGIPMDTIILDCPAEKDWILYAPYTDKTCMRNIISYDISNKMGHYASRTKLCELVLNGQYQGIYVLMEKIKADNNRVDISKLQPTDISGDELTGGYIVKIDKTTGNGGAGWTSNYPASSGTAINILYHYPSSANIVPQQQDYIHAYIDSFENALAGPDFTDPILGYANYASVNSFIDYFILDEISKNVDGYRISTYLHKNKDSNGGKLKMGPAWDYNLGWWNADYCEGDLTTGWAYQFNDICGGGLDIPFWWERLMEDPAYTTQLRCRWEELRQTTLSINSLNLFIDSIANYLDEAQGRYFTKWPILGQYVWPNPSPIPSDYAGEIVALKNWITYRIAWMDANLPGICDLELDEQKLLSNNISVYPNPFNDQITTTLYLTNNEKISIELYNLIGEKILFIRNKDCYSGINNLELDLTNKDLEGGLYLLKITTSKGEIVQKLVKE